MSVAARFCLLLLISTIAHVAASPYRKKRDTPPAPTGPVSNLTGGTAALLEQLFAAYFALLRGFPLFGPMTADILSAANPGNVVKTIVGSVDTLTGPVTGALGNLGGIIPGVPKGLATGAPVATTAASA